MITKILKVSIPIFLVIAIIIYFFDPTSIIPLFLVFLFFHLILLGYEILKKELEISLADRYFPVFFKNLSRSVEVGIAPIKAIIEICKERYGEITKYFRVFKRKLEAGVNIDNAFNYLINIFKENRKITNSLQILKYELKSGYGLKEAIDSIYNYILKIVEVERERKVIVSQFTMMFYAISFIFAAIIFVLIKVLTPIYSQFLETSESAQPVCLFYEEFMSFRDFICSLYISEARIFKKDFSVSEAYIFSVLLNISLLQAIFSGIIIGYGVERSIAKSILHSSILFIIIFLFFFTLGKIGML